MTDQQRQSRAALFGHGRRSMGLGKNDPRERRDAAARQRDSILSQQGGLKLDGQGKLAVDLDQVANALEQRNATNGGS